MLNNNIVYATSMAKLSSTHININKKNIDYKYYKIFLKIEAGTHCLQLGLFSVSMIFH